MTQGDLFKIGLAEGHAAAQKAADHAGPDFKTAAAEAFREYARRHIFFTTEDVRLANPDLPTPPDKRAWGAIALRAKRDGIIDFECWDRAVSKNVHGSVIAKWQSRIYNT